ncbi:uncharacterized protein B0I36DRAFT_62414 [Microdochium trichocladiopsis]|uniref:Uncharacterized protein n=1 Tax=Microdochium trichocladiopsis TaxID=1682393 RepID=A0A9P9BXL0_9PEZI|nr:uncharacterized protein B0I36DRAFT_62414 [Microdochium trichocladiopsis]KAH7037153.1 hypothetical protein B0I36DRAFT_62414 [Microdochium trichocladiopsis]
MTMSRRTPRSSQLLLASAACFKSGEYTACSETACTAGQPSGPLGPRCCGGSARQPMSISTFSRPNP